jgi:hypothetical protein
MGKPARKQINRLQLRREVIRVLSSDNLARVAGGYPCGDTDTGPCPMSVRPTTKGE